MISFILWLPKPGNTTVSSDSQLYSNRQMAAAEAACHRVNSHVADKIDHSPEAKCENRDSMCSKIGDPAGGRGLEGPMSAEIEPCSWITDVKGRSRLPYYLWDKKTRETVNIEGLAALDYTAISHTWGRWRTFSPKMPLLPAFLGQFPKILFSRSMNSQILWTKYPLLQGGFGLTFCTYLKT